MAFTKGITPKFQPAQKSQKNYRGKKLHKLLFPVNPFQIHRSVVMVSTVKHLKTAGSSLAFQKAGKLYTKPKEKPTNLQRPFTIHLGLYFAPQTAYKCT